VSTTCPELLLGIEQDGSQTRDIASVHPMVTLTNKPPSHPQWITSYEILAQKSPLTYQIFIIGETDGHGKKNTDKKER